MDKITIVGAGRVGESTAHNLAKAELCRRIALIDIKEGMPQGTALDIQESAPIFGFDAKLTGHNELSAMSGSDLIIITAGVPRKPGMSRSDVLDVNVPVIASIVDEAVRSAPQAMILMVTNPVDVLTYVAWKRSGWQRNRVFGLSGVLDSTRMASFVAIETGFSVKDISAMVLGGHGDTMVPLPRYTCVNGIPISRFLDAKTMTRVVERTRQGGAEILALRKTSSAYDAPAAAVATMVDAIQHGRRRILPCVAILDGEYHQHGICMGVPVILGSNGMEQVVELELNQDESAQFSRSAENVRADLARLQLG
ncbi:MAG: malate dehydrogenase [Gammaproteobacteria bacterium]|nr:malate dehydrogenase [Gammaproteobacteria bacterium]